MRPSFPGTKVAPVYWLVADDVHDGRKHLNFSTWDRYTADQQARKLRESWEQVEKGEMPLWIHMPTHRDAVLSPEDKRFCASGLSARRSRHYRLDPRVSPPTN